MPSPIIGIWTWTSQTPVAPEAVPHTVPLAYRMSRTFSGAGRRGRLRLRRVALGFTVILWFFWMM